MIILMKSRKMIWARHAARKKEKRKSYRSLVGKPEGQRPLGRPRRMWVDNIKIDLGEIANCGADWIFLAQDREKRRAVLNVVMNLRVP
jgi:hypothetical protein